MAYGRILVPVSHFFEKKEKEIMKIDTFLTLYKNKKNEDDRVDFLKSHVNNKYIPLEEKQVRAKNIVNSSYYQKDDAGDQKFHINSVAKYMLTCMTLLDLYTDLERNQKEGKVLEEFNKLNEQGVFDILVQSVDQRELKEFNMVLDMESSDLMANEYEPGAFVRNQVERFGNLIGTTLLPLLDKVDAGQIEEIVKRYVK